jgi:K+-transporting ATPase ATPase C chain
MLALVRATVVLLGLLTAVTGAIYPLAVTVAAQALFSAKAEGSLVRSNGRVVGSRWVGQPFDDPGTFWGRPSATAPYPYNTAASGASNLGPSNPALVEAVRSRVAALRAADPEQALLPVPGDLVTASASGLDPEISPRAALYQVHRVARVRGLPVDQVRALVERGVEGRTFGVLGEPRVNVLALNVALDDLARTCPK